MRKYISLPDGGAVELEGDYQDDVWKITTWTSNGVLERSSRKVIKWVELSEFDPEHWARVLAHTAPTPEEVEESRLANLQRAARRAKTMCRRVIISENFNELLTLTYRENQTDRALCKHHFSQWCRRMKKALPGFRFCASFERQERGAMHVHLATHRLPLHASHKGTKIKAFELGTRIWRSVVGANNGMCHVGGSTRFGGRRRSLSLAKMAAYVSKYILKDFHESPDSSNRYQRSIGTVLPKKEHVIFYGISEAQMLELVYEYLPSTHVHAFRFSPFGGAWFCSEFVPPPT